ncbi:MAG TPA: 2-amino-4-hydroxy-6-hydroxymethyldihydropteridine diphosphokinase [Gaiellaceae bacterium]|nr:2-amino-4-hydroxy-6-hydroxymethyldihydropteridine diphosphokinase [Gaiellaceae bacterium]
MTRAYVGLGANLGAREETLRRAVELLAASESIEVVAVSKLRETAPVGPVEQPAFLNGAIAVETTLTARELLDLLLEIEHELGRVRVERWGPRTVDLDLLVYGTATIDEPGLVVPHSHLHERRFALEPLAELDPELVIPGRGRVADALAALD